VVSQGTGPENFGLVLEAHGLEEAIDRSAAHGGSPSTGGGRIRAPVVRGAHDIQSRQHAVHDDPTNLARKQQNEIDSCRGLLWLQVQCRAQAALQARGERRESVSCPQNRLPPESEPGDRVRARQKAK